MIKKITAQEYHSTKDGWCCACDYDIAVFEGKIKQVKEETYKLLGKKELMEKFDKLIKNIALLT